MNETMKDIFGEGIGGSNPTGKLSKKEKRMLKIQKQKEQAQGKKDEKEGSDGEEEKMED